MPIHPFSGEAVTIIRRVRRGGQDWVEVEGPGGLHRRIPTMWTDLKPVPPCPIIKGRRVLFDAASLLRAVAWIDEKVARDGSLATIENVWKRGGGERAVGARGKQRHGVRGAVSDSSRRRNGGRRTSSMGGGRGSSRGSGTRKPR
jgi:hypothetical protein